MNLVLRLLAPLLAACWLVPVAAVGAPDHPVITEVYTDPPGLNDGPIGREPTNLEQEYIEIYLPPLAELAPGLDKDSLDLTIYEVEGDFFSADRGLVSLRVDLPTFDLDPSNGLTGLPRPASGVVVLGWVDYVGNPPTGLAGTQASRVALIEGGVTSTTDFTFVAINGNEFGGTTNFPTPLAISYISALERSDGIVENGSSAWLLVSRDDPGYTQLPDAEDPCCGPPFPNPAASPDLPGGTVLGLSSLLDAFAANDDSKFDVLAQPYSPPTGDEIDFENDLPLGGVFSDRVPQVAELEQGYALLRADVGKTTDDANALNDDPAADAVQAYRTTSALGPFYPTPGYAARLGDPGRLAVAAPALHVIDVLAGTTGRPGMQAANIGGAVGLRVRSFPALPANPSLLDVASLPPVFATQSQQLVHPPFAVTADIDLADGATTTVDVEVRASPALPGAPAVVDPIQFVNTTIRVLNPTTGLNAALAPFEATSFVAVQGLPAPTSGTNEFEQSSLGTFVKANLGGVVRDDRGNGAALVNPATDLGDPLLIDQFEQGMPDVEIDYINPSSAVDNLVNTVAASAEFAVTATYADGTFNGAFSAVRAIELGIPDVRTSGGVFAPIEAVSFADPTGQVGNPASGLTNATSQRGFELALVDSNVLPLGGIETGETDDFGIVVEIGKVRAGASVVPGEFVFLSMSGGLEGADLDSLDVPPHGNRTTVIYVDLDPLDTVLGALTVSRLFLVDSGGGGASVNLIEAFVLNADGASVPAIGPVAWVAGASMLGFLGSMRLRRRPAR